MKEILPSSQDMTASAVEAISPLLASRQAAGEPRCLLEFSWTSLSYYFLLRSDEKTDFPEKSLVIHFLFSISFFQFLLVGIFHNEQCGDGRSVEVLVIRQPQQASELTLPKVKRLFTEPIFLSFHR